MPNLESISSRADYSLRYSKLIQVLVYIVRRTHQSDRTHASIEFQPIHSPDHKNERMGCPGDLTTRIKLKSTKKLAQIMSYRERTFNLFKCLSSLHFVKDNMLPNLDSIIISPIMVY